VDDKNVSTICFWINIIVSCYSAHSISCSSGASSSIYNATLRGGICIFFDEYKVEKHLLQIKKFTITNFTITFYPFNTSLLNEKLFTDPKLLNSSAYWKTKFLFWIKTVLFNFLFIKESWKMNHRSQKILNSKTVSYIDYKSAYYNDFWRSCDTEDWSNDAEKSALLHRNKLYFKIY